MRLNLGCGHDRKPGWVNVDKFAACGPDQQVDLETLPWPWSDGSADEVYMSHVLEHLGASSEVYIGVMKELWRVCRAGATVTIVVPHPRHDDFLTDPTHVRAVTADGLQLFSRKANDYWKAGGFSNTPLAYYHGVDFDLVNVDYLFEEPWAGDFQAGRIERAAMDEAIARYNNVIKQQTFMLRVVK
jgi:hypothetical protein